MPPLCHATPRRRLADLQLLLSPVCASRFPTRVIEQLRGTLFQPGEISPNLRFIGTVPVTLDQPGETNLSIYRNDAAPPGGSGAVAERAGENSETFKLVLADGIEQLYQTLFYSFFFSSFLLFFFFFFFIRKKAATLEKRSRVVWNGNVQTYKENKFLRAARYPVWKGINSRV